MANKLCSFKNYMKCEDKVREKMNRKRKDGSSKNVYGWAGNGPPPNLSGASGGNGGSGTDGGMSEGYYNLDDEKEHIKNVFKHLSHYEEEAENTSKKAQARTLYRSLRNQGMSRQDIIQQFQQQLQLTPSSSTAYYERIAREFGETEQPTEVPPYSGAAPGAAGQMPGGVPGVAGSTMPVGAMSMGTEESPPAPMEKQEWSDPDKQGVIRTVNGAHLVFKRQTDDGRFEELWIIKHDDDNKFQNQLDIRRDILAGTDIPITKTKSDDKTQKVELWDVGNIQFISIMGLPN